MSDDTGRQESQQASHYEEKHDSDSVTQSTNAHNTHHAGHRRGSVDKAYDFLHQIDTESTDGSYEASPRSLRRKVDRNILPVLWFLFFFHYLGIVYSPLPFVKNC